MKKLSLVFASMVLFAGITFAAPIQTKQADKKETKKSDKKMDKKSDKKSDKKMDKKK